MAVPPPVPGGPPAERKLVASRSRRGARLERENRRWGMVGGILLAVVALVIIKVGRETKIEGEVRANKFTLVDSSGHPRAELMLVGDAAPRLAFFDREQRLRVAVGVTEKNLPVFSLAGTDEKDRLRASLANDGTASFVIVDPRGRTRAWLGAEPEGLAGLTLYGLDGKPVVALTGARTGQAGLSFLDRGAVERVGLGMKDGIGLLKLAGGADSSLQLAGGGPGAPSLSLVDKERGVRADLMILSEGSFALTLRDKKGNVARAGTTRWLLGRDQTITWSAP